MSLQLVANHLAQKGRGPDSTLVHMSNREVAGLQALAKKHGGQLSVNPDTGLPEAGFLDNILPMVAGAGLTYFSGGAISPLMAGGIIGGITALDSKDLSKGLVAGLGAYGGSGMVGGLAGLGAEAAYMPGAAGEAARAAGTEAAIANGTYQSQVGTGLGNFIDQPMNSLSTLGGGSALKGSLPILAGLAPAAVEAIDEEEGDEAPAQHKGYIRKYALDPVTGQYKQVSVYEAGGDPNVDVTAKAGTAGSYGAVGQSEYEAAQGMAAGGTATDSERIYDYLMGRGKNPMQFTSASRPQVDYNLPKTDAPITPTTPILEEVYDPYGNIQRGGMDAEGREARQKEVNERMDKLRAELGEEGYAKRNDWIGNLFDSSTLGIAGKLIGKGVNAVQTYYRENQLKDIYAKEAAAAEAARLQSESNNLLGMIGYTNSFTPYSPPIGDPAQQAAIRNAINNTVFSGMDRGSTPNEPKGSGAAPTDGGAPPSGTASGANAFPGGSGIPPSGVGPQQVGDVSSRSVSGVSLDGGGEQRGSGPAAAPTDGRGPPSGERSGGEGRNGPEGRGDPGGDRGGWGRGGGYAHGGIANLAQGYDSGGMTLPMKAQPIKNLGSMHPKALQAAYDRAVSTNDVSGARKYQNELGLREKFKNPQIYADGGETGQYNLGSYSDGGRLLKGPGDGISDDIPAIIGHNQPARLADNEFVIPARIVSEIGNGSTDAGARKLYAMMDRVQKRRAKTVGKDKIAVNSGAYKEVDRL